MADKAKAKKLWWLWLSLGVLLVCGTLVGVYYQRPVLTVVFADGRPEAERDSDCIVRIHRLESAEQVAAAKDVLGLSKGKLVYVHAASGELRRIGCEEEAEVRTDEAELSVRLSRGMKAIVTHHKSAIYSAYYGAVIVDVQEDTTVMLGRDDIVPDRD